LKDLSERSISINSFVACSDNSSPLIDDDEDEEEGRITVEGADCFALPLVVEVDCVFEEEDEFDVDISLVSLIPPLEEEEELPPPHPPDSSS